MHKVTQRGCVPSGGLQEGPIAELATKIYNGTPLEPISARVVEEHSTQGKLTLQPWSKRIHPEIALLTIGTFFKSAYDAGQYNPQEDQIIMPLKTGCGTDGLNKYIATHLAKVHSREVFEIIAGRKKHYLSVGDRVLVENEGAEIVRIARNEIYLGKKPQQESVTLDYWGDNFSGSDSTGSEEFCTETIDDFLEAAVDSCSDDETTASSHVVAVKMIESGEKVSLDTSAQMDSLVLSYALTLDESKDSKWDMVFLILHQSHNAALNREWLYTAVTRAKKQLYIICEPDVFSKAAVPVTCSAGKS